MTRGSALDPAGGSTPRPPVHPFASVEIKSWLRPWECRGGAECSRVSCAAVVLWVVPVDVGSVAVELSVAVCCCRLRLFQNFESFRVLVCGGDGSVSWVLSEIDKLGLHKQVHNLARFRRVTLTVTPVWHFHFACFLSSFQLGYVYSTVILYPFFVSDIAIFVLKRDVKLQLTN